MKRIWFVIFCLFILTACTKEAEEEPIVEEHVSVLSEATLSSEYMDWYGRTELKDNKMYYYHTATGFKVTFYGRLLQVELGIDNKNNDIYYSLGKDNEDLLDAEVYVQDGITNLLVVNFDTYDTHTVEFVKRSEPEDGETYISKLTTNGYFVKKVVDDKPHFLLIGASGISGHGALGSAGQPRTTENSSSLHSFGYLTARAFNGTYEFVANSGWGLAFGYNDKTGEENIQGAYETVGIDADQNIISTPYLHEKTPDYIIVNIGGNDYNAVINTLSGFAKTEKVLIFKQAVANFILKLRADAPNAYIIWTMTSGSVNGTAASEVIAQLPASDQAMIRVVVILQVAEGGDPAGADGHASFITHQKSAQNIIDVLTSIQNGETV